MTRWWFPVVIALLAACGKKQPDLTVLPSGAPGSPASIDSAWADGREEFRRGNWSSVETTLERINLELKPGDPRLPLLHFMLGEALLGQGNALQAVREFRRVSDDTPGDSLAPRALLRAGDAYASLWRRPELDPTYGRSALSTYQEVLNRFPGSSAAQMAQVRIQSLQDDFAYKNYKAGMYYLRLRAYESAILYFRDVVATYPRAAIAPETLFQLIKAYQVLGYQEDVAETCGYVRRFHPTAPRVSAVCQPVVVDSVTTGAS